MGTITEDYFKTVYDDFASQIEVLTKLIHGHSGEQGRFIEKVVTNILTEYLPKQYSFGTGFVIDSVGNQSRQCDIVIYDSLVSAGLLSRTGPLLFPVECVYAVLEVKATLNKARIGDACNLIASVKSLKNIGNPYHEVTLDKDGTCAVSTTLPSPPYCMIIGYRADTRSLSTVKNWFMDGLATVGDRLFHPDHCVSISEAVEVSYVKTSHTPDALRTKFYPLPLRDGQGNRVRNAEGGPVSVSVSPDVAKANEHHYVEAVEEGGFHYNCRYKVCDDPKGEHVLCDAPTALMTTLNAVAELLRFKKLTGTVLRSYFTPYFGEAIKL